MNRNAILLEDMVTGSRTASEALDGACLELQGRVQTPSAEIEGEPEDRSQLEHLAALGEMAMGLVRIDQGGCSSDCTSVADHELMHRMLQELVVSILNETTMEGTARLTARVAGSDIVVEVEDNGSGVHETLPARLFDSAFSSQGISIVKGIVDSCAGEIRVEAPDNGTPRVVIHLRNAAMEGGCINTEVAGELAAGSRR
jgi:nitrogen fixation/metabolism regulation signal transduction histidine kinase